MSFPKPLQRRHHKSGKHRIKNPDALAKQAEILERELVLVKDRRTDVLDKALSLAKSEGKLGAFYQDYKARRDYMNRAEENIK